jgi:hypothetical protein
MSRDLATSLRFLTVVSLLCCASLAQSGGLWFADAQSVQRIDTDTNVVTQVIPQQGVLALALNQKDSSLWVLTSGVLTKLDANGATLAAIDLKGLSINFNAARRLALDPGDDSIWVAGGNNAFHLDSNGRVLANVTSNAVAQDIALAQDGSLWLLGRNALSRYSPQGTLLGSAGLAGDMQQAAVLALDDANGALWLGGSKSLFRIALALPVQSSLTLATSEVISALALDSGTGALWVAGQSSLFGFTKDGTAFATTSLAHQNLGNFQVLDFDAQSQALWLGHEKGISRFSATGQLVATLAAGIKVSAISAAPSGIVPIVSLVSPPNGALTRNALIPIRLHYDASCFGQPCGFPPSVFAAYTLTATLNRQPIESSFVFDPATDDAVFTPAVRYPEGVNSLSAFVTDSSGRRSKTIASQFIVDTIAPRFANATPADGSVFVSPDITLQGSIDDILGRVLLESFSGAVFTGANPQGQSFSYGISLQPGNNSFRLTATDPAGNATPLSLAYVFSTLTLTVTSPSDGATIDDTKVTVTGTFSGATTATISVNGVPAVVSGSSFKAADVPLHFGFNTLTVSGSAPQGATATRTLTVTGAFPSITLTSPANGATVNGESLLATGRIQAPANSGVTVNGVIAIVDAGGNFYANAVPLQPGINTLTATVTTQSRKTVSVNNAVSSSGPLPVVISATALQGPVALTVAFRFENLAGVPLASFSFNPGGAGNVAASGPDDLIAFTYTQAGTYQAALTLFDTAGTSSQQPFAIQAQDPAQLDQLFRALWNGVNTALVAGDKAKAMTFLNAAAQEKYGPVFDKIMPQMASLVASYSPLQRASLSSRIGEYAINRTIDGVNRIFFIYFLQDANGAWLIDAM